MADAYGSCNLKYCWNVTWYQKWKKKKWFSPPSFLLPISVIQSDFLFYCVVHLDLDLHSKRQGIKNLKNYYLCILRSSCREGMRFQVSLNCKFDLHFTQKNRTLHIYNLLFRKSKKRIKQNNKKPCHNRWKITNPLR